jgi:cell division protein FtsQ
LQQIGTGQPIWWRARRSPTPSQKPWPVLKAAAKLPRPLIRPKRRKPTRLDRILPAIGLGFLSAAAFMALAGAERSTRPAAQALAEIEHMVERAGYGLTQVSLTGHRFTTDSDIFEAIDLASTPTMLSFDSRAAQERIERLPWIERASVERVLPDRLEVSVTERTPFAVWRLGSRNYLIDKTGRVLAAVPAATDPSLPRIAGEGAATEAAALYRQLAEHPALQRQVSVAERIGERRWTLRLANGGSIALPAYGEADALARASVLAEAGPLRAREMDMRVAARTLLRGTPDGDRHVERASEMKVTLGGI